MDGLTPTQARGRFAWYELMTTDPIGARAFYPHVTGWTTETMDIGPMPYQLWKAGDKPFGGVMELPAPAKAMGAPTHWLGYLCSPDTDASVARAVELGATTYMGPMSIPTVGRVAILADPQGAVIGFYTPETTASPERGLGRPSWHELMTEDAEAAWSFYSELFGWVVMQDMDMGPHGTYRMYGTPDGVMLGGIMKRPEQMPKSAWNYYIQVPNLEEAIAGATSHGATLVNGPMDVPGGDRVANLIDPQGGHFALHWAKPAA